MLGEGKNNLEIKKKNQEALISSLGRSTGDNIFFYGSLKPIFHWKWGSRWLPNANEIYTQKKKCTWPTQEICVWDPTQPIFHWLALGVLRRSGIYALDFVHCVLSQYLQPFINWFNNRDIQWASFYYSEPVTQECRYYNNISQLKVSWNVMRKIFLRGLAPCTRAQSSGFNSDRRIRKSFLSWIVSFSVDPL